MDSSSATSRATSSPFYFAVLKSGGCRYYRIFVSDKHYAVIDLAEKSSRAAGKSKSSSEKDGDYMQRGKGTLEYVWSRAAELCQLKSLQNFLQKKGTLASVYFKEVKRQTSQADLTRVSLLGSLLIAQSLNKIDDAPIPPSWNSFEKSCICIKCSSFMPGSKIWPSLRSPIKLRVLKIVKDYAKKDLAIFSKALCARNLVNQVDRKLMKQTVTTSVHGVTYIGARIKFKKKKEVEGTWFHCQMIQSSFMRPAMLQNHVNELAFGHHLSAVAPQPLEMLLFPSVLSRNCYTIIQEEVIAGKLEEEAFVTDWNLPMKAMAQDPNYMNNHQRIK
ncbi:hypothetical protein POM88_051910 [Heracleum sosnowskyi]|uniref:DNA-directed RNA polymerase n=1 Tax=Heracleum sosnowskyi TaxID=360622 RepID=A0AAD8GSV3_9APIA|nr:hypothetical protein POM88_051910 [Heracleum sosnowskyi]